MSEILKQERIELNKKYIEQLETDHEKSWEEFYEENASEELKKYIKQENDLRENGIIID